MAKPTWRQLLGAVSALAFLAPVAYAAETNAPGFALSRFEPAERGSHFFTIETLDWRSDGLPTFGLVFDYAYKPLVIYQVTQSGPLQELKTVARDFFVGHVGGSINLGEQFRLGFDAPVLFYGYGGSGELGLTSYLPPHRTGFGDLRVAGDWRFYGKADDSVRLGLGVRLYLPTGDTTAYMSDGAVRATLQVQAAGEAWQQLAWSVRLGAKIDGREVLYAGSQVGHEVQAAAALGWKGLGGALVIGPELYGSTTFNHAFSAGSSAFELMLGAHYDVTRQWRLGAGLGHGVTVALGSPTVRALLSLEWTPFVEGDSSCQAARAEEQRAAEERLASMLKAQQDRDAELARAKAAAEREAAEKAAAEKAAAEAELAKAQGDDDGDGIINKDDACPTQKGPANADKAKNGCPTGAVVNGQLVLDLVRFGFGSDVIAKESEATLSKVLDAITQLPADYRFRVEGHTDTAGPAVYNKSLSQRRAQSVVTWFGKHGVDAKRFEAVGFGPDRPVADNDSDANRLLNRRVEIHIINLEAKP